MTKRHQLPPRRHCLTVEVVWTSRSGAQSSWTITIGVDEAWKVREVFGDGHKAGTDLEGLFDDACILISMALQSGHDARALAAKLGREGIEEGSPASSFIGFIVTRAAELEARIDKEASSPDAGIVLLPDPQAGAAA